MSNNPAEFSANVGHAHGPNWLKWVGHLAGQPAHGLELGMWRGEFAEWLLDNILTHPSSRYTGVDTFEGSEEHRLAGIDCSDLEARARGRLAHFGGKVEVVALPTNDALRFVLSRPEPVYDFVYCDAAHDAMNVLRDSVLAFELLKTGGIFVWDDYQWTVMEQEIDRPRIAIDAFLSCYARRVEVIGLGWQVAAKKIA